jgi:two-component system, sporulation sensor kinase E
MSPQKNQKSGPVLELEALAACIAHEIKNPLTALKTFTDHLPQKFDEPAFREQFVRVIRQEIDHMEEVLSGFLSLAKNSRARKKSCNVEKILKEIIELLNHKICQWNIGVVARFGVNGLKTWANPNQIKQVFLNILINAMEAMKDKGGELRITTTARNSWLNVAIEDAGCGILPKDIERIFDPFFSNKERGTGLGLAIASSLIKKNKGHIEVWSQPGIGSRFDVRLPINFSLKDAPSRPDNSMPKKEAIVGAKSTMETDSLHSPALIPGPLAQKRPSGRWSPVRHPL